MPLCKIKCENRVRSITPNTLRYFHETWYKYKTKLGDMQKTKTATPPTLLTEYSPFIKFTVKIVSAQ